MYHKPKNFKIPTYICSMINTQCNFKNKQTNYFSLKILKHVLCCAFRQFTLLKYTFLIKTVSYRNDMNSFSFFSPCFRNGWLDPCQLWVVVTQAESFVVLVGSYLHANVLKHLKHYWDIISETFVHIPQNQGKPATWWRRSLPIKILDQNYHYLMMKSLKTTFNRKMLCIFCTLTMICRIPLYQIWNKLEQNFWYFCIYPFQKQHLPSFFAVDSSNTRAREKRSTIVKLGGDQPCFEVCCEGNIFRNNDPPQAAKYYIATPDLQLA